MTKYQIRDTRTGELLPRQYQTNRTAHQAADRMDNRYGAVRYQVQVQVTSTEEQKEETKQ